MDAYILCWSDRNRSGNFCFSKGDSERIRKVSRFHNFAITVLQSFEKLCFYKLKIGYGFTHNPCLVCYFRN